MATGSTERHKALADGAIYCLSMTPYQYVARHTEHQYIAWVLVPLNAENRLIGGPNAYVTHEGRIGVREGLTDWNASDLLYTGRHQTA